MLFNSLHFFVFFLIVTTIYFSLPHKFRWFFLLASSCYFYMVFVPIYILILAFTIFIDYFAGIYIEKAEGKKKRWFLIASLIANIGVLSVFKYYNFFNDNLTNFLHGAGFQNPLPFLSILLPIGLSFHTFQAMSYTIEVYRGNQNAEKHFGIYALYVMFYPQLVAGPIERPQNMLHQFREKHSFDYESVTDGLKLMAWGLFKKVVIADRIAAIVDNIYDHAYEHSGLSLIIATIFFSFQIFCDFSGYSDIAIGAGQVMGFTLMKNFDRPYHSKSIHEFWGRWHISLSSWFKDYLYISLGGNRVSIPRWYWNLFIVFLLSGLWHGANWTFLIWGALNGFYLIFALITSKLRIRIGKLFFLDKLPLLNKVSNVIMTFGLITFAWIFFRANSLSQAVHIVKYSIVGLKKDLFRIIHHLPLNLNLGISNLQIFIGVVAIIFMEIIHIMQNKYRIRDWIKAKPTYIRWSIYLTGILTLYFVAIFDDRKFIYFQF